MQEGFLPPEEVESTPDFPEHEVDFDRVTDFKTRLLERSFQVFKVSASPEQRNDFEKFSAESRFWLDDYALFVALKDAHGEVAWNNWEGEITHRTPEAMKYWREKLAVQIESRKYRQYLFFKQWRELKRYCNNRGIQIMGDIPIFPAYDSAEVWAHPELFDLDEDRLPRAVAGVPPDYFSSTGQLWGNPLYLWKKMAESGYKWWIDRFRWTLGLVDIIRIDHFRGFEAYWEVPADEKTAVHGRWVKGPGAALFHAVQESLGEELPVVAENLGEITPEVEALRRELGYPGMAVLQFAFGQDPREGEFLPHNFCRNLVAYPGTHDNDTVLGWWASTGSDQTLSKESVLIEREFAARYLGSDGSEINWAFIKCLLASNANTVIVTLQDVLGLGSEARMNVPGRISGNWHWRFGTDMLSAELKDRLRDLSWCYGRSSVRPRWAV